MARQITCIKKDGGNHLNPHEAIQTLGWTDDVTGRRGTSTRVEMYEYIVGGGQAYVDKDGAKAMLIAERNIFGTPYVKTVPDWTKKDNLLDLPECRTLTY